MKTNSWLIRGKAECFEMDEMKKRTFAKSTWYDWYDWLINYTPEPIKAVGCAKDKIVSFFLNEGLY